LAKRQINGHIHLDESILQAIARTCRRAIETE
jgi:hypothetical protein